MDFLSAKGVSFILDDFGSGYTNLVELNTMPFSLIKFDKKIIQPGLKTLKGSKILEGMVDIFKRNGAMVAAEGVEAGEQAGTLALMNFDYLQGYYFGKPESGEQLLKNLQATRL
jgi:EAL domain-containing protein (putative c-di-GMP-specific phosphodiesterase class I)